MIYIIHMLYVLLIHIGMDQFKITISIVNHLLYVIIIMLIYGIKIIRKMPIILTHHHTYIRIEQYVVALTPIFYGPTQMVGYNYKGYEVCYFCFIIYYISILKVT
jgi:hypothetical protein